MSLDKKLQELATSNWTEFLKIMGDDLTLTMKARIMRRDGKSWQQISVSLSISPKVARRLIKEKPVQNGQA